LAPLVKIKDAGTFVPRGAPDRGQHGAALLARGSRDASRASPGTSPESAPPARPLDGVTVLELGLWYAAPYGSALLADLGARVVKIEPLTGEPMRHVLPFPEAGAVKVLQGKESVALSLEQREGLAIVRALARRADIVLMGYRAGVAERLGVD